LPSTTKRKTIYNKAARKRQLNLKSLFNHVGPIIIGLRVVDIIIGSIAETSNAANVLVPNATG
jgi:hypothetical protein